LRTEREVGRISLGKLCAECSTRRQRENIEQLQARRGPYYDRWLAGRQVAAYKLAAMGLPNYAA
jgi:hypothetical protein